MGGQNVVVACVTACLFLFCGVSNAVSEEWVLNREDPMDRAIEQAAQDNRVTGMEPKVPSPGRDREFW